MYVIWIKIFRHVNTLNFQESIHSKYTIVILINLRTFDMEIRHLERQYAKQKNALNCFSKILIHLFQWMHPNHSAVTLIFLLILLKAVHSAAILLFFVNIPKAVGTFVSTFFQRHIITRILKRYWIFMVN